MLGIVLQELGTYKGKYDTGFVLAELVVQGATLNYNALCFTWLKYRVTGPGSRDKVPLNSLSLSVLSSLVTPA